MPKHKAAEYADSSAPTGGIGSDADGPLDLLGDFLCRPEALSILFAMCISCAALVPGAWLVSMPLGIVFGIWATARKYRLPFRLPESWSGPDYGNAVPGGKGGYRNAEGILYLGNDMSSGEELWISNSDARRHAFILGTTGAGKALPCDALVLTPAGWRRNGDLEPGQSVIHPSGRHLKIVSVHPQGRLPVARLHFMDGRMAECSRDHLWKVRIANGESSGDSGAIDGFAVRTAADIGFQLLMERMRSEGRPSLKFCIEYAAPATGPLPGNMLTADRAIKAGRSGLERLRFMPSLAGEPEERLKWMGDFLSRRRSKAGIEFDGHWIEVPAFSSADGWRMRHLAWSLGGLALALEKSGCIVIRMQIPEQEKAVPDAARCDRDLFEQGLEIVDAEGFLGDDEYMAFGKDRSGDGLYRGFATSPPADAVLEKEMICIRTDAEDGLFVMENYLSTHNTELLLGLVSQAIMWSSGFLFIDGKGTSEFHARAWSLACRFGRQDDYRILNFTDGGGDRDAPAGGPSVQSNTMNPFASGSADQLMNLVVSLMGDTGAGASMWHERAMSLVASTMKALCEMRDAGDILLDVQAIRDYLPLGTGIRKDLLEGKDIKSVTEIPAAAWSEMRGRGGMIELYLRALNDEFSESSRLALKGFFDTLPGFSLENALNGEAQDGKAAEQYGFLAMQLTKPLGSLADDFGHIFRTPFGEVDIDDIVLNRRILVVLLPALQKAPEEMRNCGKIVVALLKMMMGKAAGSELEGSKLELVEAKPTRSPVPFIAVLDEAGYYMVKGIDTMMAQARSLGFMIILAGQDMAAMQSVSPQIAETASANARLTAAGAMEDSHRTWDFLRRKFDRHKVAVSTGRVARNGLFRTRWVDRMDVSFAEVDRVRIGDLQKLKEGEFYYLFESTLVKTRTFYIGESWVPWISSNKFLRIRGPCDSAPGLDQSKDIKFVECYRKISKSFLDPVALERHASTFPKNPADDLAIAISEAERRLAWKDSGKPSAEDIRDAYLVSLWTYDGESEF